MRYIYMFNWMAIDVSHWFPNDVNLKFPVNKTIIFFPIRNFVQIAWVSKYVWVYYIVIIHCKYQTFDSRTCEICTVNCSYCFILCYVWKQIFISIHVFLLLTHCAHHFHLCCKVFEHWIQFLLKLEQNQIVQFYFPLNYLASL